MGDTGDSLELDVFMAFIGTEAFFSGRPERLRLSKLMFRLPTLPQALGTTGGSQMEN